MAQRLESIWQHHGRGIPLKIFKSLDEVEGNFNLIVISHVIEHLINADEFIQQAKQHLTKNNQLIFIEVPNNDYRYKKDVHGHVLFFGPAQMYTFLQNQGFKEVFVAGYGKSPTSTPMNENAPKLLKLSEKIVNKAKPVLPFAFLSKYYDHTYGVSRSNPEGTWLRAIVK